MADTLITPINDSFVDFDVLGNFDPINLTVTGESHYAKMVSEARRERRLLDGRSTDWIVIRNRLSGSRNNRHIADGLTELGKQRPSGGQRDLPNEWFTVSFSRSV